MIRKWLGRAVCYVVGHDQQHEVRGNEHWTWCSRCDWEPKPNPVKLGDPEELIDP